MAELGLDISREFPRRLTTDNVQAAGVVITMGCGDACPVYPGKRYLDWDLPDPAGLSLGRSAHPRRDRPPGPGPAHRTGLTTRGGRAEPGGQRIREARVANVPTQAT
jgi:hypothetical protein